MFKISSYLLFTSFLALGIFSGCQSNLKIKDKSDADNASRSDEFISDSVPEVKFNRRIAEIAIMNNTLPYLVPHTVIPEHHTHQSIHIEKYKQHVESERSNRQKLTDSLGMTLYVNDFMMLATKKTVSDLIEKGASPLLMRIVDGGWKDKLFNTDNLIDFDGVRVGSDAPFTTAEKNRNVGGINFSIIVFSKDKTRATFIYEFQRFHNQNTAQLCAVEVELQKEKWVITSKTCNNP
jgi:hypothetical protein